MRIPNLSREDAVKDARSKTDEISSHIDYLYSSTTGPVKAIEQNRKLAGALSGHSLMAMLTLDESGHQGRVYFHRGPAISHLRVYSIHKGENAKAFVAAKERVTKGQVDSGQFGEVNGLWVGQIGDVNCQLNIVNDVILYPQSICGQRLKIQKTEVASDFGIKDVTRDFTLKQFDVTTIRPDGALVITGPPGVGKTTVAIERLFWLLQLEVDPEREEEREALIKKFGPEASFRPEKTFVLVRKEHLRSYLSSHASALQIPNSVVVHLDRFLSRIVKDLAGAKRPLYGKEGADDVFKRIKDSISWEDLLNFVTVVQEDKNVLRPADMRLLNEISKVLKELASDELMTEPHKSPIASLAETIIKAELKHENDATTCFQIILDSFDETLTPELLDSLPIRREDTRVLRSEWRKKIRSRLNRVAKDWDVFSMLFRFYDSEEFKAKLQRFGLHTDVWEEYVESRRKKLEIRPSDHLPLLALAEAIDRVVGTDKTTLFRAAHIVIDEAQLMPPLLLRLIREYWCGRMGSCTLVGDPRQAVDSTGSNDYFTKLENVNVQVLSEIHRVTREQFDFLEQLAKVIGIQDHIEPGRYAANGPLPYLSNTANDFEEELNLAIETLDTWYHSDPLAKIVIVPCPSTEEGEMDTLAELLSTLAEERGIPLSSRFDGKYDITEQDPVLTHIDALIGLEFDYLLLLNTAEYCSKENTGQNSGAIWIAASRPRKQFGVILRADIEDSVFKDERVLAKSSLDKIGEPELESG